MKKLIGRILSLTLAAAMLFSAVGCGEKVTQSESWVDEEIVVSGSEGKYVSGTSGVSGNGTDNKFGDNAAAPSTKTDINLKGAEVVISSYGDASQPGTAVYKNEQKLIQEIEKKYNCKLSFKYITDANVHNKTWVTQASAGVKFADIVGINTEFLMPSQIMKGYIAPIDSYFDFNDAALNGKKMNMVSYKGKHYMVFPSTWQNAPNGLWFNKALFSKFGVKTPADYVKENNWNWNTFLECAKAMTRTDGGKNYYGFAMQKGTVRVFLQSNGLPVSLVRANKDGSHSLVLSEEKALTAMQFAKDLFNKENVTTGNLTDSESTWKKGFAAMIFGPYYNGTAYMESLGSGNAGFTFLPLGKNAKNYTEVYKSYCGKGWIIPATVKNPKEISKVLYDWIYPYSWKQTWSDYHEKFFGDSQSLNTAKEMTNIASRNFELDATKYDFITNNIAWGALGVDTDQSPQAYAASVAADAAAELNQVWAGYQP